MAKHHGAVAAAMALGLIGTSVLVGSEFGAAAQDALNIWYVNPLPNTPDWGRSGRIFQEGAEANGYKATMVGPNKIDIPAMISQIEQAITDGADGIITCPLDPAAFKGVIDDAKSKGIVVASIGCVDPNATFSVGTGNEQYGRVSADLVNEQTGGAANVGIVGTDQTTPNQVAQVEGFRAQVKEKYPNIKELTWESDNSDAGIAAQKIGAMVSAYPDMNYLWIIEGAAPGAVPAALGEAGKQPGDIKVLAVDAQDSTLKAIEDGWITTTLNQCWFDTSVNIAKLIIDIKKNGKTPEIFYAVDVDPVSKDNLPYEGCSAETANKPFGY
jgi:ABC-type sugar transport system substrate-binding protein